ncbi:MAG: dipeptidase PepE [Chloroflexi bacterium]|nr:dipeptidase PepE [Chloroflexota bacterium]
MDLLLLSSTSVHGYEPFQHVLDAISEFVAGARTVAFVPFAGSDRERYTAWVQERLAPIGVPVVGLHSASDPQAALEDADVVFIGGGNTFRLLKALWERDLVTTIRRRVQAGELRFIGSSAGTNMACPTLRTTNDMPIVQPPTFEAVGLVPFQINPHYVDADPDSEHKGETREQRLLEFLDENDVPVLGLREGSWLRRHDDVLTLHGVAGARLFRRGRESEMFEPGTDLSWLLREPARFDSPPPPAPPAYGDLSRPARAAG